MSTLEELEAAFQTKAPEQPARAATPQPSGVVTADYEERLRTLGQKWHAVLDTPGPHEYASNSEADMAVVGRMVACNFSDGEVWRTLESSPRFADRVQRKGEPHVRSLFENEIAKARAVVTPFPESTMPTIRASQVKPSMNGATPASVPKTQPFSVSTGPSSFVTEYINYGVARTDAPPAAHELMAIGTLSALAGPTPRLPIATSPTGWSLCQWFMYIVDSTVGRKSTVVEQGAQILEEVLGERAVLNWEGSPQGFIQRLGERDGQGAAFVRDEFSGLMKQMNNGGHMAGLSQTFIRAFDGRTIENIRTRKKGTGGEFQRDEDRVEHPYLTMLAASTRASFLQSATSDNVIDGFLARFAFVTGSAEERPLGLLTSNLSAQRAALVDHARRFHDRAQQCALVDIGEGVLEMQWELERKWRTAAQKASRPDAAGPSMKRLAESVLKTAALLALDGCEDNLPVVTPEYFRMAEVMGSRWQTSTLDVIEDLGASSFLRDCEAVMASIEGRTVGVQLSELYTKHRSLRKRDFDQVLDALEMQNLMERRSVSTGRPGRTPIMIYPFGSAPDGLEE